MPNHNHQNCSHQHEHSSITADPDRLFKVGISLNVVFVLIEFISGYLIQSLALISDAVHNLTDVFGLLIAWLGYSLSKKNKSNIYSNYTALINSLILILGSIWILSESVARFQNPTSPTAWVVIVVALIGCVINFYSAKLFHTHQHDLNMRSAYLHLMGDAAISLGVVFSGVLIYFYAINWIDSVISAVIAFIVILSTWPLLKKAYKAIH